MFRIFVTAALVAFAGPALSATLMTATFEGVVTADRARFSQTDATGNTVTVEEESLAAGTAFIARFTYLADAAGCSVNIALCDEGEPRVHYTHSLRSAIIPVLRFEEFNDLDLRHNGVSTRESEDDPASRSFSLDQNAYVSSVGVGDDGEVDRWSENWIQYGFGGLVHEALLSIDLTTAFTQTVDHASSPWSNGYFSHYMNSVLTATGEGVSRQRDTAFRIDRFTVTLPNADSTLAPVPAAVPLPLPLPLLASGIGLLVFLRRQRADRAASRF